MRLPVPIPFAVALLLAPAGSTLSAQALHVYDRWKECAIVLDPSLTPEAWHQFVSELGLVVYFRPLASARPLGAGHVEVGVLDWSTAIDDADPAWNDTFSHPDADHRLFEGDVLPFPGLTLRAGVTDRVDIGAYFTQNRRANYGIVAGQIQYSLLDDAARGLAASARLSASRLFGPEDVSAGVYGLDLVASRDVSILSPYAGVSGYLSHGHERTAKVSLEDENVLGVQAMVGVAARLSVVRFGAEVNLARVPGYSVKVAFGR